MSALFLLAIVSTLYTGFASKPEPDVYCSLCQVVVDEIYNRIKTTNDYVVDHGFGVDSNRKRSKYNREVRLHDIIETEVPNALNDYIASGHVEAGGGVRIMRKAADMPMFMGGGGKNLLGLYETLMDHFEDEITLMFYKKLKRTEIKKQLCVELARACTTIQHPRRNTAKPTVMPDLAKQEEDKRNAPAPPRKGSRRKDPELSHIAREMKSKLNKFHAE